jgi:hypothetical protein
MPLLSMSAADWIRVKRLQGGRLYQAEKNKDIVNVTTPADPFSPPHRISRVTGSSKIRRESSKWIDYVASQTQDFKLKQELNGNPGIPTITVTRLCNCTVSGFVPRRTGCLKCNPAQHLRM